MRDRSSFDQRGFTLLELMIVVAIVAVLAAIVIPGWVKDSRRGKYDPEVRAMFAEIAVKEEQYKSETGNGKYIAAAACPAAVPSATGVDFNAQSCATSAGGWLSIRMNATDSVIRCQYTVVKGDANSAGSSPTAVSPCIAPANTATYVNAWYYITASCDMDNSGSVYTTFCTASWDPSIQKLNYGS